MHILTAVNSQAMQTGFQDYTISHAALKRPPRSALGFRAFKTFTKMPRATCASILFMNLFSQHM